MKEKADIWFDSHILEKRGTNWPLFSMEVCRRFGNVRCMDIVDEFNNHKQSGNVERYQERFDELKSYMLLVNPLLNENHFIPSYISGLKSEIKPLVGMANPTSLMDVFEMVKSYEASFKALARSITPRTNTYSPNQTGSKAIVPYQITPQNQRAIVPYLGPSQSSQPRPFVPRPSAPFKPNTVLEDLRERGLCDR